MNTRVVNILFHQLIHRQHFLLCHATSPCQYSQTQRLQTSQHVFLPVATKGLHSQSFRPSIRWPLEMFLCNIDETSFLKNASHSWCCFSRTFQVFPQPPCFSQPNHELQCHLEYHQWSALVGSYPGARDSHRELES